MAKFIEIDGERHVFEDCHHCPLYYEDNESGAMACMHPKGRGIWALFYEYLDDNCDVIPNWFPNGCPARNVKE